MKGKTTAVVFIAMLLSAAYLTCEVAGSLAAQAPPAGSPAVTMTVTAVSKRNVPPPAVQKEDAQLYLARERAPIASWKRGETLYLAVLIDDSLEPSISNQWDDLKAFLMAQSPATYIAVGYVRNGTVILAQDFTKDHASAAKAVRIPVGGGGAFTSPYLALIDWMKRWPESHERKSILLFSSGIDYFRGVDPADPDVDITIERAQKQNVNIWTIYAPDAGHFAFRTYRILLSQSLLSRVSEETGAESFYLGFGAPVTFKPYFDEIRTHLSNQYLLAFRGNGGAKGRFERARVTTELPGVEFLAPTQVFVPPAQ